MAYIDRTAYIDRMADKSDPLATEFNSKPGILGGLSKKKKDEEKPKKVSLPSSFKSPTKPKEEKSRFRKGLERVFTPENVAGYLTPLLGIAESIASRGESKGEAAMQAREAIYKTIDRARERQEKEAQSKDAAIKRKMLDAFRGEVETLQQQRAAGKIDESEFQQKRLGIYSKYNPGKYLEMTGPQAPASEKLGPAATIYLTKEDLNAKNTQEALQKIEGLQRLHPNMKYQLKGSESAKLEKSKMKSEKFRRTMSVSNAYWKRSKENLEVINAYKNVTKALDMETAAGDLAFTIALMKMLDPGSVVRDSERLAVIRTGKITDVVWNNFLKAVKGKQINPDLREEFKDMVKGIYENRLKDQIGVDKQFKNRAERFDVEPEDVLDRAFYVDTEGYNPNAALDDFSYINAAERQLRGDETMKMTIIPKETVERNRKALDY